MVATEKPDLGQSPGFTAQKAIAWLLFLVLVCLGVGSYAQMLNSRYYAQSGPFYDSMAYHEDIHTIMTLRRERGVAAALAEACRTSTVFIPFAVAALLPVSIEPSRAIGVWIQVGELGLLLWSVFYYLTRMKRQTPWMAVNFLSPLLALNCLYGHNGGLSDFRMDLSLFFTFSLAAVWYLIAMETGRKLHYFVLGLCAGLACLFRATAPVYLILGIGPLVLFDFVRARQRRSAVIGLSIAVSTAAATSIWFYVLNHGYLHYYYFVWNKDAAAGLSWQQSLLHVAFLGNHIGLPVLCFVIAYHTAWVAQWLIRNRRLPVIQMHGMWEKVSLFDFRLLWLGIAPTALLIVQGAGLNPFVCMPSVFGILVFALMPFGAPRQRFSTGVMTTLSIIGVWCCVSAASWGWREHGGAGENSMAAHKQTLEAIVDDATACCRTRVTFGTLHMFYLNTDSLHNVLLFDVKGARASREAVRFRGVELTRDPMFDRLAAEAVWSEVHGRSIDDKLDTLVESAMEEIDYLVVPNETTATFMQENVGHNHINRYVVRLRERVLTSGQFVKVSDEITNRPEETVSVYRNARLNRVAAVKRSRL